MGLVKSKMAISGSRSKQKITKCTKLSLRDILNSKNVNANSKLNIEDCEATPLWFAVRYEDEDLAKLFLSAGSDVNEACGHLSTTPLHMAAYTHNIDMVKLLLNHGANPNVLDNWNYTPMMYIAVHYEPFIVKEIFSILLKYGCLVDFGATLNKFRKVEQANSLEFPKLTKGLDEYVSFNKEPMGALSGTALHLAVQNPHLPNDCIEILLDAGATVNKLNLNAQTPLMTCLLDIYYDYHKNVKNHVELLVSQTDKLDLNVQDTRGWNCFHYAAERGSISSMELLLQSRCDCNMTSFQGETPLWILLVRGWKEAATYLLVNGCDVNHPLESVRILVMNPEVDVCRYGKIFPIEFAICNKLFDLAKLMLYVGSKIDIENCNVNIASHQHQDLSAKYEDFVKFAKTLLKSQSELQPLCCICRTVIRKSLKQGIQCKLKTLSLPQSIQDFLYFKTL